MTRFCSEKNMFVFKSCSGLCKTDTEDILDCERSEKNYERIYSP